MAKPTMRCRECLFGNHEACNGYVAKEGPLQRKMECTCAKRRHKFDEQDPSRGGPKREWSRSGPQQVCKPCAKEKHRQCEKRSCSCMKEWDCGGNH